MATTKKSKARLIKPIAGMVVLQVSEGEYVAIKTALRHYNNEEFTLKLLKRLEAEEDSYCKR
jgi:hypothetical protein